MKIVIDAREYTTSTGRYVFRLIQYLETIDTQNDYIILLRPSDMEVYSFTNSHFTKLATPYKEFSFGEQIGFARQLYSLRADLVHFGMTQQPLLYRKKSVTTIHDLTTIRFNNPAKNSVVFWIKQQIYKQVIKFAARKSKQLLVPSEFVKQDLLHYTHANSEKVTVTYEAADKIIDKAVLIEGLVNKSFIMYIGRPTPHKNLWRLIEAFQSLHAVHPDLKLVLAGKLDANYQAIAQKVADKQIANIVFTDYISEGQLRWLYEQCQAYVFPSLSEGFGLPGLEAMIHGAPVISSNATCLPEIYGAAAHYFDPLDTQTMADAINEVLTDTVLRQQLIAAGSLQVQKYSWQKTAEQTLAVYQKCL